MNLTYDNKKAKITVDAIRVLSADAVEKANSGHPGMPLGCADTAFILWHYFLKFNPKDPNWMGRDTFILSAGHASALLYSLMHIYGYDLSMDDMKKFRQLHSKTPGHPEYGVTSGVETTTGPLGQGFATGVGFALAKKVLQQRTGKPEFFNSKVYAIVSDGDIMEGITNEAASIAGNLGLDNLVYIYDSNECSIEGPTSITMSENVGKRFEALGWKVLEIDGFDHSQIMGALNTAQKHSGSPMLIISNTIIGKGANKKEGKCSAHGEPLGAEELKYLKQNLKWEYEPFMIPDDVYAFAKEKIVAMETEYKEWQNKFKEATKDTAFKKKLEELYSKQVPLKLYDELRASVTGKKDATRSISGRCMQIIAKHFDSFMGGSADLGPSNKTTITDAGFISKGDYKGKNIHFGIREHAMGSMVNGMSLNGGSLPFASTFLIFSDYMRASIRLSALMKQQVFYIFTHDSIYVGEDGPTHQPIEQLSSLRLIPGLRVLRPASEAEVVEAWLMALERQDGPTVLVLTRQNIDPITDVNSTDVIDGARKGAYIIKKETGSLKCVVAASGSEVALAVKARELLGAEGYMRIVSVPCMELFTTQDQKYIDSVIPKNIKRISIEAGTTKLWSGIVGLDSLRIGIDDFGTSAPADAVAKEKGLDIDSVVNKIRNYV